MDGISPQYTTEQLKKREEYYKILHGIYVLVAAHGHAIEESLGMLHLIFSDILTEEKIGST